MLKLLICLIITLNIIDQTLSYSAIEDERLIRAHLVKLEKPPSAPAPPKDHAKVARDLIHKAKWASVGTISNESNIKGFPMVNIISMVDGTKNGKSTGIIYFLSTTLDFTGKDLLADNKVTFMVSDDEDLHCSKQHIDPMEPICPRVHITGSATKMDESFPDYASGFADFVKLHPAAENWIKAHIFDLFKLNIENIFVLDYYGGPHKVTSEQYYSASPDTILSGINNSNELSQESINDLKESLNLYSSSRNSVNIKIQKKKYDNINIIL